MGTRNNSHQHAPAVLDNSYAVAAVLERYKARPFVFNQAQVVLADSVLKSSFLVLSFGTWL